MAWGLVVVPWRGLSEEWGQLKQGLLGRVQSGSVIFEGWAGAETVLHPTSAEGNLCAHLSETICFRHSWIQECD